MEKENIDRETLLGYVLDDLDTLCDSATEIKRALKRNDVSFAEYALKHMNEIFIPKMRKNLKKTKKTSRR